MIISSSNNIQTKYYNCIDQILEIAEFFYCIWMNNYSNVLITLFVTYSILAANFSLRLARNYISSNLYLSSFPQFK